jgi:hypothetical protein
MATIAAMCSTEPASAQLWRHFVPSRKNERAITTSGDSGDFVLTQENGPWLIIAATFSGPGSEDQARALAQELRDQHQMPAYVHEMSFKLGDDQPGRGLDNYGAPVRHRYRRGDQVRELAVLVGNFTSIDDPTAQKALDQIKLLQPTALNVEADKTTQTMARVRQAEDAMLEKLGKSRKRGPMSQAFLTRNPLLPREYFVPKGVDPFVAKMNSGVEHSLLECPGRQTIKVATFRGKSILQTSGQEETSKSFWGRRKDDGDNPLVEAAENAHLLTNELRANGWEAYEFHDRTESIVTIGSFEQVAERLPDGRVVVAPEAHKIVQTFDASYDTPADPISGIGNDSTTQQLVKQREQQINLSLAAKQTQVMPGMNPKHVKIFTGTGKRRKLERIIPMDVHPEAIDVPKQSISGAYAE